MLRRHTPEVHSQRSVFMFVSEPMHKPRDLAFGSQPHTELQTKHSCPPNKLQGARGLNQAQGTRLS